MAEIKNPWSNLTSTTFSQWGYSDQIRTMFGDIAYIDPYTTGYHYIFFTKLPSSLNQDYGRFLTTTCQSVNVPGITVNQIQYNGTNNMKWSVPGTVEYDSDRVTVKFIEFAGLPILQIMGSWISIFRNIVYGVASPYAGSTSGQPNNAGVNQADYKGRMIYATTRPDGCTVQYASVFTGVYPLKIPSDRFSSDKGSHEKVEPEIEFSFDMMYTGASVLSTAQSLVTETFGRSVDAVNTSYSAAANNIENRNL